jgi:hypothetical protein
MLTNKLLLCFAIQLIPLVFSQSCVGQHPVVAASYLGWSVSNQSGTVNATFLDVKTGNSISDLSILQSNSYSNGVMKVIQIFWCTELPFNQGRIKMLNLFLFRTGQTNSIL